MRIASFFVLKIGNMFSVKDPIPSGRALCVNCRVQCFSNSCYVGEINRPILP